MVRSVPLSPSIADWIVTFTPYLSEETNLELSLTIPIHELSYDDFATFVNVQRNTATYLYLIQFWRKNNDIAFTLDDLEQFVLGIENDYVREGLLQRLEVARISGLFGPNVITGLIKAMCIGGGGIIFNLSEISHWERRIAVEFILRRLAQMGQAKDFEAVSLFANRHNSTSSPTSISPLGCAIRTSFLRS